MARDVSRQQQQQQRRRRGFLFGGVASLLAGWVAGTKSAVASVITGGGSPVTTRMRQGDLTGQPLDTMLLFERGDDNNGRLMTHEVLSLVHEERGKTSHPWTLYASLATHHESGDGCVVCSRLHKHGPGWSTGLHSEVYTHGRAVAIGVNVEMSNDYAGHEPQQVIGVNVQAVGGPTPMQAGLQIHDNESGQAHFDTAIALNGSGRAGVDLSKGKFGVGVNAGANAIRVSEGTCIELEETGRIKIRYKGGRIEFLNGEKCVGHIDVSGEDHAL
jgi:hypothetical protein